MKKFCISIIVCLFTFLSFGQTNNLTQQQALDALKDVIRMDEGTFPRDMGNGLSWDKNSIEGNDFFFYYTYDNPQLAGSSIKFYEETARKMMFSMMAKMDQDTKDYFVGIIAQAGLNLAFAFRYSPNPNYFLARMTNKELYDFLEGKLSVAPIEFVETLVEQYKQSAPCQIEPGVTLTNAEIKEDKFVMYLAVDNATILNNLQANKDALRTNLKAALGGPLMTEMCGMLAAANVYLVYYYYCEEVSESCIFAFSPEELKEIKGE